MTESIQISAEELPPIAGWIFSMLGGEFDLNNASDMSAVWSGVFLLYGVILALAILTYKLGFARKLPVLKSAVVYGVLAVGCTILTVPLGLFLPIAEALVVSSFILGVYRYRLHKERSSRADASSS